MCSLERENQRLSAILFMAPGRNPVTILTMNRYLIALLAIPVSFALADTFDARVVGVTDGDTITILDSDRQQQKIRFSAIDAPERRQPFGTRSTQNLARYVAGKDVHLVCHKVDRYKRKVCKVWVQPADCGWCTKTLDVGLAQITDGMAWWYRRYADEQTAEDRGRYESAEQEARSRKRGLWQETNPVPPWDWRGKPSAQRPR
jgi:endonuclease YncB( thermonuclease family)